MSRNDPELFSHEIEWYLTAREADLGIRSSLSSQIAQIEGLICVSGTSDRYHHAQTTRSDAVARDRRLRPVWASLSSYDRDVLSSYYTGCAKVHTDIGYRRFPRGAESRMGPRLAGVAFFLATMNGTTKQLVAACETGTAKALEPWSSAADEAVRAAHRSFYTLQRVDTLDEDEDETTIADGAFGEIMAEWSGTAARSNGGIWRQVG